jgi:LAO/AO transport system kinase
MLDQQYDDGVIMSSHRELARRLSAIFETEALAALTLSSPNVPTAGRIGFSGPPGVGKSSLIAAWADRRLARGRRVGVIAVDPSSPFSRGCVLGDRIRMDGVADRAGFYLRSLPSRTVHDGLCVNVASLLDELELAKFDDVVVETVGVGQTDYTLRSIVDTFVLVLSPEGGDVVQAMKAGILEVADVVVVNKADLPSAKRMTSDIAGVVDMRSKAVWKTPVIEVSTTRGIGIADLEDAINALLAYVASLANVPARLRLRNRYRLQKAMEVTLEQILSEWPAERFEQPLPQLLADAIEALRSAAQEVVRLAR